MNQLYYNVLRNEIRLAVTAENIYWLGKSDVTTDSPESLQDMYCQQRPGLHGHINSYKSKQNNFIQHLTNMEILHILQWCRTRRACATGKYLDKRRGLRTTKQEILFERVSWLHM